MAVVASLPSVNRRRLRLAAIPAYWHLLSLDAPTVAIVWAWSFARATQVHASAVSLAVLGIGTWLIYVGDRLLDGRPGSPRYELRERHVFHARHRRPLMSAGVVAGGALVALIVRMPAAARRDDTIFFIFLLMYFVAVHLPRLRIRFPRELVVGLMFACACAVPAWSRSAASHVELRWIVPLFAALCWLNCRAIATWEQEVPGRPWIVICAPVLAVGAGLLGLVTSSPGILRLAVAVLASAMLLFALDRDRRRASRRSSSDSPLSALALRVLADASLLTPVLLLIPWRL